MGAFDRGAWKQASRLVLDSHRLRQAWRRRVASCSTRPRSAGIGTVESLPVAPHAHDPLAAGPTHNRLWGACLSIWERLRSLGL
jgi:hypothetical protein